MAANYQTTLNGLVAASTCFTTCKMEKERLALDLYVRAMELAGNAGQPNYTGVAGLAQLKQDASAWSNQVLNIALRQAISLYLDIQNAVTVNPAFTATDLNSLSKAATCFNCVSEEQLKNFMLFLKWKLNSLSEPE